MDFDVIDISKSSPYKDFGRGFYLTDIRQQAEEMAEKKTSLFKGSLVVQAYEFDENWLSSTELNVLMFKSATRDWAEFIFKNRSRNVDFHHDFDIVYGPIANDGVAYLLGRFEEGTLTIAELAKELKYRKLNNQYFFGTEKAIKLLKRL
jgi:hypothetical protein